MKDLLRVETQQRVDKADFEQVSSDGPLEFGTDQADGFVLKTDQYTNASSYVSKQILSGFKPTYSGSQLTVTRGRALLSYREKNEVRRGALATSGDASKTLELSGYAPETYRIAIRFEYNDGSFDNRRFWDAQTDTEFIQEIATKRLPNWGLIVVLDAPSEYITIGRVTVAGGVITAVTDERPMFFEGPVLNDEASSDPFNYGQYGLSRSDNRALDGMQDLHSFVRAMTQKLEEIQSGTNSARTNSRWWKAPVNSLDDVLPLSGATGVYGMRGNIELDADGAYDLGASGVRWANIFTDELNADFVMPKVSATSTIGKTGDRWDNIFADEITLSNGVRDIGTAIAGTIPRVTGPFLANGSELHTLYEEFTSDGTAIAVRSYFDSVSGWHRSVNAVNDSISDSWERDVNTISSSREKLTQNEWALQYELNSGVDAITWADIVVVDLEAQSLTAPTIISTAFCQAAEIRRLNATGDIGSSLAAWTNLYVDTTYTDLIDMNQTTQPTSTGPNEIVGGNTVHAWGVLRIRAGVLTGSKLFNCTASLNSGNNSIDVTLDNAFSLPGDYGVVSSFTHQLLDPGAGSVTGELLTSRTASLFALLAWDAAGVVQDIDHANAGFDINFQVFGLLT